MYGLCIERNHVFCNIKYPVAHISIYKFPLLTYTLTHILAYILTHESDELSNIESRFKLNI